MAFGKPKLRSSPEYALHKQAVAWWLASKPDDVIQFVRRVTQLLQQQYDMWSHNDLTDVPWRRSAVQFVLDMGFDLQHNVCPSVTDKLVRCGSSSCLDDVSACARATCG